MRLVGLHWLRIEAYVIRDAEMVEHLVAEITEDGGCEAFYNMWSTSNSRTAAPEQEGAMEGVVDATNSGLVSATRYVQNCSKARVSTLLLLLKIFLPPRSMRLRCGGGR